MPELPAGEHVVGSPQVVLVAQDRESTACDWVVVHSSSFARDRFIKVNSPLFLGNNPQLNHRNHTDEQNASESGGDNMIHVRPETSANWNTLKLATGAELLVVLAGCAVAVPLRPLTMASQDRRDRDLGCAASSKCPNATTRHRPTSRPSQPVVGGNIAEEIHPIYLNSPEACCASLRRGHDGHTSGCRAPTYSDMRNDQGQVVCAWTECAYCGRTELALDARSRVYRRVAV